jgi:hypothetical protein
MSVFILFLTLSLLNNWIEIVSPVAGAIAASERCDCNEGRQYCNCSMGHTGHYGQPLVSGSSRASAGAAAPHGASRPCSVQLTRLYYSTPHGASAGGASAGCGEVPVHHPRPPWTTRLRLVAPSLHHPQGPTRTTVCSWPQSRPQSRPQSQPQSRPQSRPTFFFTL